MRLWSYQLLPYLPNAQFKGELRELLVIMRDWRDKDATNHLLINRVMKYPKKDFTSYFMAYAEEYATRYKKIVKYSYIEEFLAFSNNRVSADFFKGWHNKEYLRVCMANLYEKHYFGLGKSRITDAEWDKLCEGYKKITGSEYKI